MKGVIRGEEIRGMARIANRWGITMYCIHAFFGPPPTLKSIKQEAKRGSEAKVIEKRQGDRKKAKRFINW